jgi:hypothetical protein
MSSSRSRSEIDRRFWTEEERQYVRDHPADSARTIAAVLNRSVQSIRCARNWIGCPTRKKVVYGPELDRFVVEKHGLGWSDAEIAVAWGCERHLVGERRKRLSLPSNALSDHFRERVRMKTREQLDRMGLPTLAALRCHVFRQRARAAGWPEDLRPRAVQILNLLWENGPMTRRQIADATGMPWKGSRKSLVSNDPEGSYLAHLLNRGPVITLGRIVKGIGRGHSTQLYSLPLSIERRQTDQVLGGAQLKGATFIQNNYPTEARPDQPAKARPGSKEKLEIMRRRVDAGLEPCSEGDDAGGDLD